MMIRWLDDAINDLQSLRHYISQDNTTAARKVVKKILHAIDILSEQPGIGRPGSHQYQGIGCVGNTLYCALSC